MGGSVPGGSDAVLLLRRGGRSVTPLNSTDPLPDVFALITYLLDIFSSGSSLGDILLKLL